MITREQCDYCWRDAVALLTARRNTFWRTLFGLRRPTWRVCRVHLEKKAGWRL